MKYIDTNEGIEICKSYGINISRTSLIKWIIKYGIGKKVIGRWGIDPDKLKELIEKEEDVKQWKYSKGE